MAEVEPTYFQSLLYLQKLPKDWPIQHPDIEDKVFQAIYLMKQRCDIITVAIIRTYISKKYYPPSRDRLKIGVQYACYKRWISRPQGVYYDDDWLYGYYRIDAHNRQQIEKYLTELKIIASFEKERDQNKTADLPSGMRHVPDNNTARSGTASSPAVPGPSHALPSYPIRDLPRYDTDRDAATVSGHNQSVKTITISTNGVTRSIVVPRYPVHYATSTAASTFTPDQATPQLTSKRSRPPDEAASKAVATLDQYPDVIDLTKNRCPSLTKSAAGFEGNKSTHISTPIATGRVHRPTSQDLTQARSCGEMLQHRPGTHTEKPLVNNATSRAIVENSCYYESGEQRTATGSQVPHSSMPAIHPVGRKLFGAMTLQRFAPTPHVPVEIPHCNTYIEGSAHMSCHRSCQAHAEQSSVLGNCGYGAGEQGVISAADQTEVQGKYNVLLELLNGNVLPVSIGLPDKGSQVLPNDRVSFVPRCIDSDTNGGDRRGDTLSPRHSVDYAIPTVVVMDQRMKPPAVVHPRVPSRRVRKTSVLKPRANAAHWSVSSSHEHDVHSSSTGDQRLPSGRCPTGDDVAGVSCIEDALKTYVVNSDNHNVDNNSQPRRKPRASRQERFDSGQIYDQPKIAGMNVIGNALANYIITHDGNDDSRSALVPAPIHGSSRLSHAADTYRQTIHDSRRPTSLCHNTGLHSGIAKGHKPFDVVIPRTAKNNYFPGSLIPANRNETRTARLQNERYKLDLHLAAAHTAGPPVLPEDNLITYDFSAGRYQVDRVDNRLPYIYPGHGRHGPMPMHCHSCPTSSEQYRSTYRPITSNAKRPQIISEATNTSQSQHKFSYFSSSGRLALQPPADDEKQVVIKRHVGGQVSSSDMSTSNMPIDGGMTCALEITKSDQLSVPTTEHSKMADIDALHRGSLVEGTEPSKDNVVSNMPVVSSAPHCKSVAMSNPNQPGVALLQSTDTCVPVPFNLAFDEAGNTGALSSREPDITMRVNSNMQMVAPWMKGGESASSKQRTSCSEDSLAETARELVLDDVNNQTCASKSSSSLGLDHVKQENGSLGIRIHSIYSLSSDVNESPQSVDESTMTTDLNQEPAITSPFTASINIITDDQAVNALATLTVCTTCPAMETLVSSSIQSSEGISSISETHSKSKSDAIVDKTHDGQDAERLIMNTRIDKRSDSSAGSLLKLAPRCTVAAADGADDMCDESHDDNHEDNKHDAEIRVKEESHSDQYKVEENNDEQKRVHAINDEDDVIGRHDQIYDVNEREYYGQSRGDTGDIDEHEQVEENHDDPGTRECNDGYQCGTDTYKTPKQSCTMQGHTSSAEHRSIDETLISCSPVKSTETLEKLKSSRYLVVVLKRLDVGPRFISYNIKKLNAYFSARRRARERRKVLSRKPCNLRSLVRKPRLQFANYDALGPAVNESQLSATMTHANSLLEHPGNSLVSVPGHDLTHQSRSMNHKRTHVTCDSPSDDVSDTDVEIPCDEFDDVRHALSSDLTSGSSDTHVIVNTSLTLKSRHSTTKSCASGLYQLSDRTIYANTSHTPQNQGSTDTSRRPASVDFSETDDSSILHNISTHEEPLDRVESKYRSGGSEFGQVTWPSRCVEQQRAHCTDDTMSTESSHDNSFKAVTKDVAQIEMIGKDVISKKKTDVENKVTHEEVMKLETNSFEPTLLGKYSIASIATQYGSNVLADNKIASSVDQSFVKSGEYESGGELPMRTSADNTMDRDVWNDSFVDAPLDNGVNRPSGERCNPGESNADLPGPHDDIAVPSGDIQTCTSPMLLDKPPISNLQPTILKSTDRSGYTTDQTSTTSEENGHFPVAYNGNSGNENDNLAFALEAEEAPTAGSVELATSLDRVRQLKGLLRQHEMALNATRRRLYCDGVGPATEDQACDGPDVGKVSGKTVVDNTELLNSGSCGQVPRSQLPGELFANQHDEPDQSKPSKGIKKKRKPRFSSDMEVMRQGIDEKEIKRLRLPENRRQGAEARRRINEFSMM